MSEHVGIFYLATSLTHSQDAVAPILVLAIQLQIFITPVFKLVHDEPGKTHPSYKSV